MWPDYAHSRWKWHGEPLPMLNMREHPVGAVYIAAMLHDAFGMHDVGGMRDSSNDDDVEEEDAARLNLTSDAEKFYRMIKEGKTELYPGCGKSKLEFMLQLYQLKIVNSWSDVSFTGLLDMIKGWFPEANLPANFYPQQVVIQIIKQPTIVSKAASLVR